MNQAEHCYGKVMRVLGGTIPVIVVLECEGNFVFTTSFCDLFNVGRAHIRIREDERRLFLEIPFINKTVDILASACDREEIAAMLEDTTAEWLAAVRPVNVLEMMLIVGQRR